MNELLKAILEAMGQNGLEIDESKAQSLSSVLESQIGSYVSEKVSSANAGLEKNKNEILEDYKKMKAKFGDEAEFDRLKKIAEMYEQNEEMQMFAEGKHEEVFEKRMAKQKAQWEKAYETKDSELAELTKKVEALMAEKTEMVLSNKIKEVASKTKGFRKDDEGAMELLTMVMSKDWSLNEENGLVYKTDPERISAKGKTFDVDAYLEEDFIPRYGKMVMDEVEGGANLKSNSNPLYNGGSSMTKNLDQMGGQARDNMSDSDWIARRKEQLKK